MTTSLDYYSKNAPSDQAMLDIFKGEWSSRLPANTGLSTSPGPVGTFEDPRIAWAERALGGFEGKNVLELGPLEGGHSCMMQRAGAKRVVAVEANSRAFLKCLVIQKIFALDRIEFLFGDFNEYLAAEARRFDIVVASGVLYHMVDPVRALELICAPAPKLMLWTHYYDQALIEERGLSGFFGPVESRSHAGVIVSKARRNYLEAVKWEGFCGGGNEYAYWLDRDSLLDLLRRYGFVHVEIEFDEPNHPNGPALALCASK